MKPTDDESAGAGPHVADQSSRLAARSEQQSWRAEMADSATAGEGVADGDAARHIEAQALLPAELLQPGEVVVLLIKPSVWYIVLSCLGWLAAVLVMTVVALELQSRSGLDFSRRDTVLLGMAVAGVRLIWQFFEWLSRVYVLTDRRIIRVQGVLRVRVFECVLGQIQHTTLYFSMRERCFGLGTVGFATAGTGIIEATWEMVDRPLEVHETIVKTLGRYGR